MGVLFAKFALWPSKPVENPVENVIEYWDTLFGKDVTNLMLEYLGTGHYALNLEDLVRQHIPGVEQVAFKFCHVMDTSVRFEGFFRKAPYLHQIDVTWDPESIFVEKTAYGFSIPRLCDERQRSEYFFAQLDTMQSFHTNAVNARFKKVSIHDVYFTEITIADTTDVGHKLWTMCPHRFPPPLLHTPTPPNIIAY